MTQFNTTIIAIRGADNAQGEKPVLPPSVIDEITKFYRRVLAKVLIEWLFPDWDCPDWWWDSAIHDWRNLDLWPLHLYPKAGVFSLRNREVHVEKAYYLTERMELFENGQIIEPRFYHWENVVPYIEHCRTIDPTGQTGIINMTDPEVCSIDDLPYVWNAESPLKAKLLHVFGTDVAFGEERQFLRLPYLLSPTEQFERTHGVQRHQQQKNLDGTWWINESTPLPDEWWPEIDPPFVSNEERFSYQRPEEVVITYPYIINQDVISPTWDNDENHYETSFVIAGGQNVLAVRYAPTRIETVYDFKDYLKAHFTPDVFTTGNVALKLLNECYIAAGTRVPKYDDMGRYSTMTESEAYYLIPKPRVGPSRDELLRWANRLDSLIEDQVRAAPVRVMYNVTITLRRARINRQVGLAAEIPFFHNPPVDYSAPNRVYVEVEEERDEVFTDSFNTAHQPGSTLGDETVVDGVVERVLNESGIERASVGQLMQQYFEIPSLDKTMRKAGVSAPFLFFCVLGQ
ncbi:hypothetical protein SPFM20_00222 [Salmonella phage SPFM20]|nr:hypothetical protein SPFM20_00222 [Salmonella phage SPFM20]